MIFCQKFFKTEYLEKTFRYKEKLLALLPELSLQKNMKVTVVEHGCKIELKVETAFKL